MSALHELSFCLSKPVKELADWNFPLSKILEEYYSLLDEPSNINFGEAALVLQNSVNVFARRVENLYDETARFNETFTNYEAKEMSKSSKNGRNCKEKVHLDLEDFKLHDLSQEVGTNINLKSRNETQKTIKLISRRFTQLESDIRKRDPIKIFDVNGELIGNKYDFRCNQYININGALVEELTPYDFICDSPAGEKSTTTVCVETDAEKTGTSGYCSNASHFESTGVFSDMADTCHSPNVVSANCEESTENCDSGIGCDSSFNSTLISSELSIANDEISSTSKRLINEDNTQDKDAHTENVQESQVNNTSLEISCDLSVTQDVENNNVDIDSGYLSGTQEGTPCIKQRR